MSRALPTVLSLLMLAVAAPAAGAATNPWLEKQPLNIAHQGGEDEFPSNTMYAFERSLKAGADMLELDVGVTKDDQVVVMHDTTLDRTTNGSGTIASHTLAQVEKLDGAYWFHAADDAYRHDRPAKSYTFRGVATGKKRAPKGYTAADFRVPTLRDVLKAFPKTPINIEIKGRTKAEAVAEYEQNAEVLAKLLKGSPRRDLIVVSFKQEAVNRFHQLAPKIPLAPGIGGTADWLLGGKSPGENVVAFQLPITYELNGTVLNITTAANVAHAHQDGYAWHTWLSDDGESPATWTKLIDWCVDGVMTARPVAFEKLLKSHKRPASCAGA
ncbi:MAG TPA: glycerophosphodiester phosphodiesterase family protein [Baekduia sp.]|uniref:glycerophosphodiester phosphodiesterase family protein n=1 Tax=Baekduia sp. TaxID=2600305 RepID=UPI002BF3C1D4|nr:glycerophosphodiester phosphodiesterase family protein [Baekduia sp.]HMJ34378.1 glycerophosphodiester phosphodiesterase family protein [Baekduia sp.]